MTTQSNQSTDTIVPPSRKQPMDGHSMADAGENSAADLKTRFRDALESGKTRVTEWKGGLQDNIRERPIQSVLIAAAVGATIGLLIGRRSR